MRKSGSRSTPWAPEAAKHPVHMHYQAHVRYPGSCTPRPGNRRSGAPLVTISEAMTQSPRSAVPVFPAGFLAQGLAQGAIPAKAALLKQVKSRADVVIGDVKVAQVLGGMRGLRSMVWEGSHLDANEGIRFHGKTIADCQRILPKHNGEGEMKPEAMFWSCSPANRRPRAAPTSSRPSWPPRESSPSTSRPCSRTCPRSPHPMTQFVMGVAALNTDSVFAKAYERGVISATTGIRLRRLRDAAGEAAGHCRPHFPELTTARAPIPRWRRLTRLRTGR
ncbi:hypothetical protein PR048_033792 [Dryococelus australis]|uniref:Uncharacterized protein n=1 Tax=Dryococelus australis TaxID=614101 RepID=A0ABQ9FYX8_9NEOP|nr:hypothetical protein PR048_033792 [Dryococelus australis]